MASDEPSQLRLGFTRFADLAPRALAPGYSLRAYRAGDEEAWIRLLNSGDFGTWDHERLARMLAGERAPLPRAGIFFVTRDDRPVGTACVFLHDAPSQVTPELGWVVVEPAHRGRGLGGQVCRAALGFVGDLGHRYAYLLTEDFRRSAIKTYLRLGFEPEMLDASHPARWAALRRELGLMALPAADADQSARGRGEREAK